jgi:PucR C-terminal helix-turn-helix domain/GAF domain
LGIARAGQTGSDFDPPERMGPAAMRRRSVSQAGGWPAGAEDGDYPVLYETLRRLGGLRDVASVSDFVIERARVLLKTDLAFIALRDREDRVLHMLACVGHRTEDFMGLARPVEQGIAVYERRPMYSADFLNDNRLSHHPDTDARVRAEGIRSVLVVPLAGPEAVVGMLAVANRSVHSFTEREVLLLSEVGAQAAVALDSARLYSSAVSSAATAETARARTELALKRVETIQQAHDAMIEALLAGQGMAGVLAVLNRTFGVPVIATDWRKVVLAHHGAEEWLDSKGQLSRSMLSRSASEPPTSDTAGEEQLHLRGGTLLVRVATADESLGYLWFPAVGALDIDHPLVATAQRAARVLALELIRERVAVETERRLGRDFLLNLLSDAPADPATLESLARQVWRRYGSPHRPVTIRVGPEWPTPTSQLERARRVIAHARPGDLVAAHRGEIVLMLAESDRGRAGAEVGRLQALLAAERVELSMVIGAVCRDLSEDRRCTLACVHLHELLGFRPLIWLEELESLTILFEANDRKRLDQFVHTVLGPIAERPELIATLRAYYVSGRNRARAARQLNVHVNTLRYRLERIESLIGRSFDDPAKEAAIQLAVSVRGEETPDH